LLKEGRRTKEREEEEEEEEEEEVEDKPKVNYGNNLLNYQMQLLKRKLEQATSAKFGLLEGNMKFNKQNKQ
jgi:phage antirepressor YoqD-like protein